MPAPSSYSVYVTPIDSPLYPLNPVVDPIAQIVQATGQSLPTILTLGVIPPKTPVGGGINTGSLTSITVTPLLNSVTSVTSPVDLTTPEGRANISSAISIRSANIVSNPGPAGKAVNSIGSFLNTVIGVPLSVVGAAAGTVVGTGASVARGVVGGVSTALSPIDKAGGRVVGALPITSVAANLLTQNATSRVKAATRLSPALVQIANGPITLDPRAGFGTNKYPNTQAGISIAVGVGSIAGIANTIGGTASIADPDKTMHTLGTAALTTAVYNASRVLGLSPELSRAIGGAAAIGAGTIKEGIDQYTYRGGDPLDTYFNNNAAELVLGIAELNAAQKDALDALAIKKVAEAKIAEGKAAAAAAAQKFANLFAPKKPNEAQDPNKSPITSFSVPTQGPLPPASRSTTPVPLTPRAVTAATLPIRTRERIYDPDRVRGGRILIGR